MTSTEHSTRADMLAHFQCAVMHALLQYEVSLGDEVVFDLVTHVTHGREIQVERGVVVAGEFGDLTHRDLLDRLGLVQLPERLLEALDRGLELVCAGALLLVLCAQHRDLLLELLLLHARDVGQVVWPDRAVCCGAGSVAQAVAVAAERVEQLGDARALCAGKALHERGGRHAHVARELELLLLLLLLRLGKLRKPRVLAQLGRARPALQVLLEALAQHV